MDADDTRDQEIARLSAEVARLQSQLQTEPVDPPPSVWTKTEQTWDQALRISHTRLTATLSGDTPGAVVVSDAGDVGIQIGPIIGSVQEQLTAQGFAPADRIPEVSPTIVVAESEELGRGDDEPVRCVAPTATGRGGRRRCSGPCYRRVTRTSKNTVPSAPCLKDPLQETGSP